MTLLAITTEYAMTPFEFLGGFAIAITFILLLVIAGLKEEIKELKKNNPHNY